MRLDWNAVINDTDFLASIRKMEDRVKYLSTSFLREGNSIDNVFSGLAKANERFYTAIAQSEMGLQKVRNEQNNLNRELKQGIVNEQDYIEKTSQLTYLRQKLNDEIKNNKTQLQQYNAIAAQTPVKPAFTKQDTINEINASSSSRVSNSPGLSATEAFARATQESVNKLNAELSTLESKLKSGAITNDQYAKSTAEINNKLKEVQLNQEHFNNNVGKGIVPTVEMEKQKSVLDSVSAKYREMVEDASSAFQSISPKAQALNNNLVSLRQESASLQAAQKELSVAFQNGDITQKQYLESSRNLAVQQNAVKSRISETQKEISKIDTEERRSIGSISEKTAKLTQLQAAYNRLSEAQRNNASVGGKIKKEYQELSQEVDKLNKSLYGTKSEGIATVLNSLRSIGGAMGIAFGVQQLVSFGVELFNIAKQAEGIELAFARMGDTTALTKLKEATRGTVSELELMKVAVRANNFQIPMDVLAKGLAFAQQRAKDTGQDVDYMVNSFVDGLGRKSSLVLDNLGISLVEIQKEVRKVGDYNIAVGNIIEREMARSGAAVDTLAEKTARASSFWEDFKKKIASVLNPTSLDAGVIQQRTEFLQVPIIRDINSSKDDAERQKHLDKLVNQSQKTKVKLDEINKELAVASYLTLSRDKIKEQEALASKYGMLIGKIKEKLSKDSRSINNELTAINNAYNNSLKAKGTADTNQRKSKGIYSDTELTELITKTKRDISEMIVLTAEDKKIKDKLIKQADDYQKQLDQQSGKSDKKLAKKGESEQARLVKELEKDQKDYQKIIDKWAKVDADFLSKTLSKDDQEVESVKAKYAELKKEIEQHNKDTKGKKISLDGFDDSVATSVSNTKERQGLDKKLDGYKLDYDNYLKYQELKKSVNEKYADSQYKDNLNAVKNYYENLNTEIQSYEKKQADGTINNNEKVFLEARLNERKAFNQKQKEEDQNNYFEAIQASNSYKDEMSNLEKRYQDHLTKLGKDATPERIAVLKKGLEDEKSAILVAQYERVADTEKMYRRLSFLGKKASLDAIAIARKKLLEKRNEGMSDKDFEQKSFELNAAEANVNLDKSWIASTGALKNYRKQVELYGKDSDQAKIAQKGMFTALASDLQNASALIGDVGGLLGSLGASDETQKTVNQVGELVGGMGELAMGIASGNPIAIISGGIKTLTSAIDLFSTKDKKIQKQIDAYKVQLDSLSKSYDALQKKMSGNDTNYYANSDQLISDLKQKQIILEQMAQAEDDKKKTDKEKVKGYRDEAKAINEQIEDIEKSVRQMRLQTDINSLAQSITDALVGAFESGEDGIEAMDKAFENFIKNSLANSARLKFVQKIIDDMLNQVDQYMANNDNSLVGFDFTEWDKKLNQAGKEVNDFLESAYDGLKLQKEGEGSGGGLSGSIKQSITESQANVLEGLWRNTVDISKRSLLEVQTQGLTLNKQLDLANSSLVALNAIQNNTANTVARLDTAIGELQKVNKNLGGKF